MSFSATSYCKGIQTAAGVPVKSGIVAADPEILPVGSVVEIEQLPQKYNGIYTVMDTGLEISGTRDRRLHVELQRGAGVRPPPDPSHRAPPGLEPGRRRRRAFSIGCSSGRTPTAPARPSAASLVERELEPTAPSYF